MKKLLLIITIFIMSMTPSFAVMFIDVQGDYKSTGDYESVAGFGTGFGFTITDDVNFLLGFSMTSNTEDANLPTEISYEYRSLTGGIEYIPPIAILDRYRIYWKSSINLGVSEFSLEGEKIDGDDFGPSLITAFRTGLQYNFTQVISPYFNLGYHYSFYTAADGTDAPIKGWQADLGVRFYILGNRDYNSRYQ